MFYLIDIWSLCMLAIRCGTAQLFFEWIHNILCTRSCLNRQPSWQSGGACVQVKKKSAVKT